MYYGLILLSVAMFGACFALNDVYRKQRGSGLRVSMEAAFIGSVASVVFLALLNGLRLEFTLFTLVMALLSALNVIAFTFFTFRALDAVNLSVFSVFSMLGGMVLPSLLGIFFYEEKFTLAKALCFLFICIALALTVKRGEGKGSIFYCIGIFILNGLSGVISKLFNELPFPRADAASYSMWGALWTALLSGILWLVLYLAQKNKGEETPRYTLRACGVAVANGSLNKVANFLLVLALLHVDASVQYPMVTGGVMVVSTLLCYFGERKPSKRELLSVAFAFLGTLLLFVIPV